MIHRLLIVDDQETILYGVRRFFERSGFTVDCASELGEAQALICDRHYDVVIADLRLTGVHGSEGLELISFIKMHSPRTKTILLTAYSTPEVEADAYARGACTVVRKPQPLAALAQIVYGLLAEAAFDREVESSDENDKTQ
jgi:DNA-binding NtrC family response regulator